MTFYVIDLHIDNEPPQFQDGTCPSDVDVVAGAGMAYRMVSWTNPSATDNTGDAPTIVCTPQSGSNFMIGTQDVTCTATDAAGNKATPDCIFEVAITGYLYFIWHHLPQQFGLFFISSRKTDRSFLSIYILNH